MSSSPASNGVSPKLLLTLYATMRRMRLLDERLTDWASRGGSRVYLSSRGQEAVVVGSVAALEPEDWVVPGYRGAHGVLLWRGQPIDSLLQRAESSRQVPLNLSAKDRRVCTTSPLRGNRIAHAVGIGWAARVSGKDQGAAVFLEEGEANTEGFRSAYQLATGAAAGVVFVCLTRSTDSRMAASRGAPAPSVCDGIDALAVWHEVRRARQRAVRGAGPQMVFCQIPPVDRSRARDPLAELEQRLRAEGIWSEFDEPALVAETMAQFP